MAGSLNIPFRCPNCADKEKFESLHELRRHLENEHGYVSDRARRRMTLSRLEHCDDSCVSHHSSLLDLYHEDARKLEENLRKSKEEELNNKRRRGDSAEFATLKPSLSQQKRIENISSKASFREYGHCSRIEKHFLRPRKLKNTSKLKSKEQQYFRSSWSDGDTEDDTGPFLHGHSLDKDGDALESGFPTTGHRVMKSSSRSKSYRDLATGIPQSDFKSARHVGDTLTSLSHQVMKERASQQATANSLYTAHEVLDTMEQAAEQRICQQQEMIETLANRLKEKEKKLANIMQEMDRLRHQQYYNMENINFLRQKSDQESEHLRQELQRKQKELDALNGQITEVQQSLIKENFSAFQRPVKLSREESFGNSKQINHNVYMAHHESPFNHLTKDTNNESVNRPLPASLPGLETVNVEDRRLFISQKEPVADEASSKEEELRKVKNKAQQLERDRQNLQIEMQNLLENAAVDNDKLRTELESQSQRLKKVNLDLEQSKQEQAELLGETNALYQQADVSLAKLKSMLKEREQQLSHLSNSLDEARTTQGKLAQEKEECVTQAREREAMYKSMLTANSVKVNTMKETLESSQEQKRRLERMLGELSGELAAKDQKDRQLAENMAILQMKLAEREKAQTKLKEEVKKREGKLKKAKHEMERMTNYLKNTAEKELEARSKLETFISGLIDRAGRAEAELKRLKSSYDSKSGKSKKKKEKIVDLSGLPGVSAIAYPQNKSAEQGAVFSDYEDTSYIDPPPWLSQHKDTRSRLHSTPKSHRQGDRERENYDAKAGKHGPAHGKTNRNAGNHSPLTSDSSSTENNNDIALSDTLAISHLDKLDNQKTLSPEGFPIIRGNEGLTAQSPQQNPVTQLHSSAISHSEPAVVQFINSAPHQPKPLALDSHGTMQGNQYHPSYFMGEAPHYSAPHNQTPHSPALHPVLTSTAAQPSPSFLPTTQHLPYHLPSQNVAMVTNQPSERELLQPHQLYPTTVPPQQNWLTSKFQTSHPMPMPGPYRIGDKFPPSNTLMSHVTHDLPVDHQPYPSYRFSHLKSTSGSTVWSTQPNTYPFSENESYRIDDGHLIQENAAGSQRPYQSIIYRQGQYSVTERPPYISVPSAPNKTHPFTFENTPEVEKMFQNVYGQNYLKRSDIYSPGKMEMAKHKPDTMAYNIERKQDDSFSLSVDDNGIMWEPHFLPYPPSDAKEHKSFPQSVKNQKKVDLIVNEDTDIDENLTDYLYEEEQNSHEESEDIDKIISKPKKAFTTKITRAQVNVLREDPLPLGEKIAKLLTSLGPEASNSAARQNYHNNRQTPSSPQPNTNMQKPAEQILHSSNSNKHPTVNDYSTTESSEPSPLDKARAVQMRIEKLTSPRPVLHREISSPKLSDGFEVDSYNAESDFSSSSYESLGHVTKQSKKDVKQQNNQPSKAARQNPNVHFPKHDGSSYPGDGREEPQRISEPKLSTAENNEYTKSKSLQRQLSYSVKDQTEVPEELVKKSVQNLPNESQQDHIKVLLEALGNDENQSSQSPEDHTKIPDAPGKDKPSQNLPSPETHGEVPELHAAGGKRHDLADKEEVDQDLTKYKKADLKPARELRARLIAPCDAQATSSEDDLLEQNVSHVPHKKPVRNESVDASTDTDLEKLAMPAHQQKGFVVRKNTPTVRHVLRKKPRPKPAAIKFPSEESISSGADDLDDEGKAKRQAARRMRVALFRVFSYLDNNTLLAVSHVCREWCRVSRHPALWRRVTLKDRSISSEFLITLSKWCTQTRSLTLQGLRGRDIKAEESSEQYVEDIRASLEPGLEKFLSGCQNSITALHISDCDNILTDKCLWLVSGYCRLLTALTYRSSMDPISPQLMWALGGGCPGISSLFVHPQQPCQETNAMNNRCLQLIGQFYEDIQELGLGGKEFDKAGLLPLVQSCQRLKSLYLDHCLTITSDVATTLCKAGLKHLQTLTISGTSVEAKALQIFQGNCRQLNKVNVSMSLQDCVADPKKKKDKETYKKMVKALEALRGKLGFGVIFNLDAAPVE